MLKVKLRKKKQETEDFHATKKQRFLLKLNKISDRQRRKELIPPPPERNGNGSLDLNKSGNRIGLHQREVPAAEASARMKKVRAMRRFYNKQMPVPQCNGCAYSAQCPKYRAGYECAFLPFLNAHKIDSIEDLIAYMKEMVGANMRRTQWALTAETLSGGSPSLETSEAFNMAFSQLKELYEIATKNEATVEIETDDQGIIGQIFGGLKNLLEETKEAHARPIEVDAPPQPMIANDDVLALPDKADMPADVNKELLSEFNREELLSRTKKRNGGMPVIEVSTSTVKQASGTSR